jgi:hypothetical protein
MATDHVTSLARTARLVLGAIRLVNGATALVAPGSAGRRLGVEPGQAGGATYPLRLFGVRTVVLGADLLRGRGTTPADVAIHATDTVAAVLGGVRKELPRGTATLLTCLSAGNTVLAYLARERPGERG